MAASHVVLWEIATAGDEGVPLFDVWLVPADEAATFAFQRRYPSAAVVAAHDDAAAREAWERGAVLDVSLSLRVPAERLDHEIVLEAVRRWARDEHGVPGVALG